MAGLLASGDLYFSVLDDVTGEGEGFIPIGNATKFEIQVGTNKKERISKGRGNYSSALDTVYLKKSATLKIVVDDLDTDNLALAFLGSKVDDLVVAGSIAGEAATAVVLDKSISLAKDAVSNVVVKDVTLATTYVLGTDYTINEELGFVTPITGGAITALDVLSIDYDYQAVSQSIVQGGTENSITVALRLVGENLVDNSKIVVDVWKSKLAPTNAIDFLSENFANIQLDASLELVTGKQATFQVRANVVNT